MKDVLKHQEKNLSLLVAIPLIVFILILTVCLWVASYNAMLHELDSNAEELIREMSYEMIQLETQFGPELTKVLEEGYTDSFPKEKMNEIRSEFGSINTTFPIKAVNYYRITDKFQIYDTDFAPDLGMDFNSIPYLINILSDLTPGRANADHLVCETATGDIRLYAYIKLEDGSYFELGIKFAKMKEWIQTLTDEIFTDNKSEIAIYIPYSPEEHLLFEQSRKSKKPVYQFVNLINADFYVSKVTKFGTYNFIIHTKFNYPLYFLSSIFIVTTLLLIFRCVIDKRVRNFSEGFSKNIETLDRNMKNFQLTETHKQPEPIRTEISEIHSISKTFLDMRKNVLDSYEALNTINEELELAYLENQTLLTKVEAFINFPDYLLYLNDTEKFLKRSFEKILKLTHQVDYGYVTVINEDGTYNFLDFRGLDVNLMNRLRLVADRYPRSDHVALFNYTEGQYYREHNDIPELKREIDDIQQALAIPIATENHYYGSMTLLTKCSSSHLLTEEDYRIAAFFSNYLKGYLTIKELSKNEEELHKDTIYSLIRLLEQHDPYTKGHSESVAKLASDFARFLNFSEQSIQEIYWAGIVHDMGKVLIPNSILNKPVKLTSEEFELIKKHPVYAYDVLKKNKNMENVALYIRHHHENFDGSGYPDGLKGQLIPFESRLLTIADSWDAMTAERVYKKGIGDKEALEEMKRNAGSQFDPELVEKWIKFIHNTK